MEEIMAENERRQKIEAYGSAYALLTQAIQAFPREMWQYRPAADQWTIHEILVHITDSEANSFVRCRRFLAEPGSSVLGYDEMKWARDLHYHEQSPEDALELFQSLRRNTYHLIKDLPEAAWQTSVNHSENGLMTLDDWLDTYAEHIPAHIRQMQAVYVDWQKQK
jgi:hypothetical protein